MAIFKLIGSIVSTMEKMGEDGIKRREDVCKPAYRLVRITGRKPETMQPERFKVGLARAILGAANRLGFENGFTAGFVCNDSAINSAENLPSFAEYDNAVETK